MEYQVLFHRFGLLLNTLDPIAAKTLTGIYIQQGNEYGKAQTIHKVVAGG